MASQASLRNQSNLRSSGRTAQIQRQSQEAQQKKIAQQQAEIQRQQQKADTQKKELEKAISQTKSLISEFKTKATQGSTSSALQYSARLYGQQSRLAELEKAYSGISQGGYYENLNDILSGASAQAKAVQLSTQQNYASAISNKSGNVVPEGAKITSIKNGIISYTLPSQSQAGVASNVQSSNGQSVPVGFKNEQLVKTYSQYQSQLTDKQKKLSQYEQNEIITSNKNYQQEVEKIISQPSSQTSIKNYVQSTNFQPTYTQKVVSANQIFAPSQLPSLTSQESGQASFQAFQIKSQPTTNQKIIQAPIKFLSGDFEFQKKFESQMKEGSKIQEKFDKTGFASFFNTRQGKGDLPYGFESSTKIIQGDAETLQKTIEGKDLNILTPLYYVAGKVVKTKPVNLFFKSAEEKFPKAYKTAESFAPEIASLTAGAITGLFFSPSFQTGALSKKAQKQIQKNQFDDLAKELGDSNEGNLLYKKEGKVVRPKTTSEKIDDIQRIINEAKTKNLNPTQKKEVVNSLKKIYGEETLTEYSKQMGLGYNPIERVQSTASASQKILLDLDVQLPTSLKGAGEFTGISGNFGQNQFQILDSPQTIMNIPKEKVKETTEQKNILFSANIPKEKVKETTKTQTSQILSSQTKNILKNIEKSDLREKQKNKLISFLFKNLRNKTQQRDPTNILKNIEKAKPIPKKPLDFGGTSKKKKTKKEEDLFSIFGRRFGKDFLFSTAKSKEVATKDLVNFLKGTLGRSGFIEQSGEKLDFGKLNLGFEFRPAKRDSKRIVQKAKFSLGTSSEIGEIQMFKKIKSKKNKLF